jgi:predicted RNA-binding Zn ribbon-like protein
MSAWRPRFLFVSGRSSLDLAHAGRAGLPARWQRLNEPGDLRDWLAAAFRLDLECVRPAELRAARELRETIREALDAVLSAAEIPPAAAAALNRAAARPDLVPCLVGPAAAWAPNSTAAQALASIARDAVELFGSDLRRRIRACQNPRCSIVFVDLSRPGTRVWCSMKRCGNLEKTSRYRKSKQLPSTS